MCCGVILLNNADNFSKDNGILLCLVSYLNKWFVFHNLSCFLKSRHNIYSFFNMQRIESNCWIIFLKLYSVAFSWWAIYSFTAIFILKRFNFWYSLHICHWQNLSLHSCFSSNQENLYIIHHTSDLFHDISITINEHNQG